VDRARRGHRDRSRSWTISLIAGRWLAGAPRRRGRRGPSVAGQQVGLDQPRGLKGQLSPFPGSRHTPRTTRKTFHSKDHFAPMVEGQVLHLPTARRGWPDAADQSNKVQGYLALDPPR